MINNCLVTNEIQHSVQVYLQGIDTYGIEFTGIFTWCENVMTKKIGFLTKNVRTSDDNVDPIIRFQ